MSLTHTSACASQSLCIRTLCRSEHVCNTQTAHSYDLTRAPQGLSATVLFSIAQLPSTGSHSKTKLLTRDGVSGSGCPCYELSIWEVEAGRSRAEGQFQPQSESQVRLDSMGPSPNPNNPRFKMKVGISFSAGLTTPDRVTIICLACDEATLTQVSVPLTG